MHAIDALRMHRGVAIPALVITGDTPVERQKEVTRAGHALVHTPVAAADLQRSVTNLLRTA